MLRLLALAFACCYLLAGQSLPVQKQTVIVTGTWEPIPLTESDRSVEIYPLHDPFLLFGSLTDGLALDSSVQVQSRAPNGVQGDISIRGGSSGQTLVLLDGIRLSDAQSAHHNLDIPVPLDAVDRIEILRVRLYPLWLGCRCGSRPRRQPPRGQFEYPGTGSSRRLRQFRNK